MNASEQLRHVLGLVPILADGQPHRISDMRWDLGIDPPELINDLQSIADRFDEPGGFVEGLQMFMDPEAVAIAPNHLQRLRLTKAELVALELGLALLTVEQPPFHHSEIDFGRFEVESMIEKLPDDESVSPDLDYLRRLREAIRHKRRVRLRYRNPGDQRASSRVMSPYGVVLAGGMWHAVLHSDGTDEIRVFRLDRIEGIEMVPVKYSAPPKRLLESIIKKGEGFEAEQPRRKLRVRYLPKVARGMAERGAQQLDPDGSLTLEHWFTDLNWAVRHVLQYGPDVEVLEPAEVREAVVQRLKAMA